MFLQQYRDDKGNRTQLDANTIGFDLSAFRKVNKVHLVMGKSDKEYKEIFSAYYKGSVQLNTNIETGSFGQDAVDMFNSLAASPITRTVVHSVTKDLLGEGMSGSFAADYTPYIKSVSPMEWTIPCFLPLVDEDQDGDFENNIEIPLNTLHRIYLPTINETTSNVKENLGNKGKELLDAIFSGTKGIAIFDAVQNAWENLGENLFGGVIQLNNPVQFDYNLKLWIGEKICIENVLITALKVDFAPLMYIDEDDNVYPAYATVDISFISKKVATYEYAKLSEKYNKNLKSLLGE